MELENTLITSHNAPRVKICDFGFSKSKLLQSVPKSTVGTPAYIAPEVLRNKEYDGGKADVWSLGVSLFVMMMGHYPFEDPREPQNFRKIIEKIVIADYRIPPEAKISAECKALFAKIFCVGPAKRISLPGILEDAWFQQKLPQVWA